MSLQTLVNVTITKQTATVTRVGFGTPLIMSTEADEDNRFVGTAKIYTSTAELGATGDNYDTAGVTFLMAQTIFSQNPKVDRIVIGKRALPPLMDVEFTPVVKDSTLYQVTIGGRGAAGADTEVFGFTSDATATAMEIVDGLVLAINGGAQKVFAANVADVLTIESADTAGGTPTAGKPFTVLVDRTLLTGQNTTADPGIVTDLNTIRTAVDGDDDWYAAFVDSFGKAEITSLAAAIEAIFKIYLPTTFDADILTASSSDIGSTLQASNFARTALSWHETPGQSDLGAAWGGKNLPADPGSITWKFKSVAGPAFSKLTPAELAELAGKNVNNFIRVAGNNMMQEGVTASGEFIDITRGIDFITARLQENIFGQMINLPKIPFTDPGIAVIENEVRGVMALGIGQGIFTADPAPVVTVPLAADVDPNDRANRLLPDVNFSAQLAGAIHFVEVNGVVTV
jgi:hypothetical protein